ncbi:MAG: trypsin-like peptidase domain-containing protein, partial [Bdellovibrionales bacterium]|nr:trypsin-like peptidase domain-containing protein [Bdellovibrionales bacterium]
SPDFSSLVDALEDSVVNISVEIDEKDTRGDAALPDMPFFKQGPGKSYYSAGSGFVLSNDGYIATCYHVIEKADSVIVRFENDKNEYSALVVGSDPKTDLALLKITTDKKLIPVFIGDSDSLKVGQWVVAIGNQFQLGKTVTAGIVSAKSRRVPTQASGPYDAFIQTDASINPGSSGGPLFNARGQVVGISTAIYSPGKTQFGGTGFNIGIGFAIPMAIASGVFEQLRNQGKVTRGLLGVIIQKIDPRVTKILKINEAAGALVADIVAGSPAEKAGAKRGDVIVKFNNHDVLDHDDLPLMVASTDIGSVVPMDVVRNGVKMQLHPKIVELTDDASEEGSADEVEQIKANEIGLYLDDLNEELSKTLKLPVSEGVLVKGIEPGSIADIAGISVGDIIEEVNREQISSSQALDKLLKSLKPEDPVLMLVRRQSGTRFLTFSVER